jgi:hypothetical protein
MTKGEIFEYSIFVMKKIVVRHLFIHMPHQVHCFGYTCMPNFFFKVNHKVALQKLVIFS